MTAASAAMRTTATTDATGFDRGMLGALAHLEAALAEAIREAHPEMPDDAVRERARAGARRELATSIDRTRGG